MPFDTGDFDCTHAKHENPDCAGGVGSIKWGDEEGVKRLFNLASIETTFLKNLKMIPLAYKDYDTIKREVAQAKCWILCSGRTAHVRSSAQLFRSITSYILFLRSLRNN